MIWEYQTAADPCDVCREWWTKGPFTDEQVKRNFPNASVLVPDLLMHPHIHKNCRCGLVNREGVEEVEEQGWDNWLAALCLALALRKKKVKPKEDEAGSPNFGFGGDTRQSFKVITRSDGVPGFFLQDSQGNYRAGANCTGDRLRAAAFDHAEGELGGLMRSFRRLLAVVKDQAQPKPKPKKKIPPLSAQDAFDIVSLIEAMTTRIRKLIDTVESEEEFKELIKAARLGSINGLLPEEQAILYEQRQPYEEYWEKNVYILPGEVNSMPPTGGVNPWQAFGYQGAPYAWQKPVKDAAVDTTLRIAKKRLDEDEKRRWKHARG